MEQHGEISELFIYRFVYHDVWSVYICVSITTPGS